MEKSWKPSADESRLLRFFLRRSYFRTKANTDDGCAAVTRGKGNGREMTERKRTADLKWRSRMRKRKSMT